MEIIVTINYKRQGADSTDEVRGELTLTNWDEQVKIAGEALDKPLYVDRKELLRAIAALESGAI